MTETERTELTAQELADIWVDVFLEVCAETDGQKRIALIERLKELERQGA